MSISHNLKRRAFEGVIWAGGQAVLSKLIAFGSQLALARLLAPEDFGVVAMANSIIFLMGAVQSGGIRSILIRRQKSMILWLNPAFWYSILLGFSAATFVLLAAPWLAVYYRQPMLTTMVPIIVAGMLTDNSAVIPAAVLQSQLRFRTLGLINILTPIGQAIMSILLAYGGVGALSLVLPKVPVGIIGSLALWRAISFRPKLILQMRRWKFLFSDSGYLLLAWWSFAAAGQIPLALLARSHGAQSAGIYSFAMGITTQVIALLTAQLDSVLFPTLAKLSPAPDLQWQAFVKATAILAQMVFFVSGLQILLAGPAVHIFFSDKWYSAVPLIQLFSVGNAMLAAAIPTGGTMQARGKIRIYCGFALLSLSIAVLCSVVAVIVGANELDFVIAAVSYQVAISVIAWRIVAGLFNASVKSLVSAIKGPLLVTALTVLIGLKVIATYRLPGVLLSVATIACAYTTVWLALLFLFYRETVLETVRQVTSIINEKRHTENL